MAAKHFVVVGLGTFGSALARRLAKNGNRVTGIDSEKNSVEALKDRLYEGMIADATDREVLEQVNLKDCDAVIISLGEDITRSLLATLHAKELGARRILVKGVTAEHGKLLRAIGVERVVFPETEIAESMADRMTWTNVIDFLPIDPEYSFMEVAAPDAFVGKSLKDLNLRKNYGVWVVGVKDALDGKLEMLPEADYALHSDQLLLLVGKKESLKRLRDTDS